MKRVWRGPCSPPSRTTGWGTSTAENFSALWWPWRGLWADSDWVGAHNSEKLLHSISLTTHNIYLRPLTLLFTWLAKSKFTSSVPWRVRVGALISSPKNLCSYKRSLGVLDIPLSETSSYGASWDHTDIYEFNQLLRSSVNIHGVGINHRLGVNEQNC